MTPRIIMTRTPLRVSFVGGGSDLPPGPGATISSSIDKHVYCVVRRRDDNQIYLTWRKKEVVQKVDDLEHLIVRECLKEMGFYPEAGVEIVFMADIPGVGSGLGSSAATCVSLLHALALLRGYAADEIDFEWLAELAYSIQADRLKMRQGKQDEYACAVGGLQRLDHVALRNGVAVIRKPISLSAAERRQLNEHFLLFSPGDGAGRRSGAVLDSYTIDRKFRKICIQLCDEFERTLRSGHWGELGALVGQHHQLKCGLSTLVGGKTSEIDYNEWPFKLCGAGGTGHLLVPTNRESMSWVSTRFKGVWGPLLPFNFVEYGSSLIYLEG